MDAEIYCSLEESIPNMVDLLKKCQDFLAEHILIALYLAAEFITFPGKIQNLAAKL